MSVDLVAFGCKFCIMKPRAVVLSVWIGVGGWMWPISLRVVRAVTACLEFMNNAPILASAADGMTFLMICATLSTATIFSGFSELSERN